MGQLFLSVVIPAYNEESRIALTLEHLSSYLERQDYSWEIIVADDGSADATSGIVSDWAATNSRISLVSLDHRGKGWAVQQGMLSARGEYRFLCDADLSMPVDQICRFLSLAGGSPDIVLGSRELPDSRRIGEPVRRHLMGRVFNLIIRALAVPGIRDTQCGFKLFKAETTAALFESQVLEGFAFDVEILCLARALGLEVREIAIDWRYREGSKVRPVRDSFRMVRDVLAVRSRLKTRP